MSGLEELEGFESSFKLPELDAVLRGRLGLGSGFEGVDGCGELIERDGNLRRFDFLCLARADLSISIIFTVLARSMACLPNYLEVTQSFFSMSQLEASKVETISSLF